MYISLEPVKGNRDGFEQILNWIGSLKVKGEDVESLEQDVLQLERLVQDINSERLTNVVNKRLLEWLELQRLIKGSTTAVIQDSKTGEMSTWSSGQFTVSELHQSIQTILDRTLTFTQSIPPSSLEVLCKSIESLEPHINLDSRLILKTIPARETKNIIISWDLDKLSWVAHELLYDHQYQWTVFIKFSGKYHRSVIVSKILWLLSEALESISGVVVEIEDQGVGSIWYKLRIFFKDLLAKEETLDTLEKVRDAAIAEADKRIEGVRNLEAQTLKTQAEAATIEKQSELIPDSEEAKKIRDLDIKKKELEIREKEADIKKKELENYKATLDLVQQTAYMMKEGMLQAAPVEIQINGQPYLSCQDGQFLPGVEMKAIDEKTLVKPEDGELQPE
jgi:hypothetical protein